MTNFPKSSVPDVALIDPADEHFEQSRADFAEYDKAVRSNASSIEYLAEPNYEQFGRGGNPWSRQGFDFDTFRDRS